MARAKKKVDLFLTHRPVFVYGTLKRGGRLHERFMGPDAVFVAEATVSGYAMWQAHGASYPRATPTLGGQVCGEVWMVSHSAYGQMDALERGAGYAGSTVHAADHYATMWVSVDAITDRYVLIPSGVWPVAGMPAA